MASQSVERIDLSKINEHYAIIMEEAYEDGRKTSVAVDMFNVLGGYAYGMVSAMEQQSLSSETTVLMPGFGWLFARVPQEGVLEPGSTTLDICVDDRLRFRKLHADEIGEAEFSPLQVDIVSLSLVDRSPQAVRREAARLVEEDGLRMASEIAELGQNPQS